MSWPSLIAQKPRRLSGLRRPALRTTSRRSDLPHNNCRKLLIWHRESLFALTTDCVLVPAIRSPTAQRSSTVLFCDTELLCGADIRLLASRYDCRGRDEDYSSPPHRSRRALLTRRAPSSGRTSAARGFETACSPADSRQSNRRGISAQCPNHGRLSAVPLW